MTNKDTYISDELLAAYLDGNTNEEETRQVLEALKYDKALQEVLNIAVNSEEEQEDHAFLPMLQMAAESGENFCSVLCEARILQRRGIDFDINSLLTSARNHKWLKPEGTPLHCIGRLLEESELMVTRQYDATIEDIEEALDRDNDVIAVVDSDKLYPDQIDNEDLPNHAILVLDIDSIEETIKIYDPQKDSQSTIPRNLFENAWHESRNYMVRVLCGIEDYHPHPIKIEDIALDDNLNDLTESIAENAHEVWAATRMAEGWTYGPVRDDKKKQHPDLIPYSALPESEKEYDRLMAINTIKLMKKLGFKIVKQ